MPELTALQPAKGVSITVGEVSLFEVDAGVLTAIAPHKGKSADLARVLMAEHGLKLPKPNRSTGDGVARCIWFGRSHCLLAGPVPHPDLSKYAALTDQSDAWVVVRLEGEPATDVLARLVPIDLRKSVLKTGHTARTELMHMPASITRVAAHTFQIMVFRSMAMTLVHDLKTAMEGLAARG